MYVTGMYINYIYKVQTYGSVKGNYLYIQFSVINGKYMYSLLTTKLDNYQLFTIPYIYISLFTFTMTSKLGCDDFIYTMYSLVLIYCNSIMKHTKKEEQGYLHGGVAGSVNLKL